MCILSISAQLFSHSSKQLLQLLIGTPTLVASSALTLDTATTSAYSFIVARLDYCYGLLVACSQKWLEKGAFIHVLSVNFVLD